MERLLSLLTNQVIIAIATLLSAIFSFLSFYFPYKKKKVKPHANYKDELGRLKKRLSLGLGIFFAGVFLFWLILLVSPTARGFLYHYLYYKVTSITIGVTKDQMERRVVIAPDGSSVQEIHMEIRATGQNIDRIEHLYKIVGLDSTAAPPGYNQTAFRGSNEHRLILRELEESGTTRIYKSIEIIPTLVRGTSTRFEEPMLLYSPSGTFAMSAEQLRAKPYPVEFTSQKISYPCNRLYLEVTFPEGRSPSDPRCKVWFGDSRVENKRETQYCEMIKCCRIEKAGNTVCLEVKYPIYSCIYAIAWTWSD